MKRYCLTLDLIDEPESIRVYENHHAAGNAWPEVTQHDKDCGILGMEIYRTGNRMFMIMETADDFSLEEKVLKDSKILIIQKWEALMWTFQQAIPWAKPGEKWVLMDRIFISGSYI
jgi:L-rhamnose mutarotase